MKTSDQCPKCNGPAEIFRDEVDIGVGVQSFIVGCECPKCGHLTVCPHCGSWDYCFAWCVDAPGN